MKMIITMMIGLLGFTYADINLWNGSYVWNRENIIRDLRKKLALEGLII